MILRKVQYHNSHRSCDSLVRQPSYLHADIELFGAEGFECPAKALQELLRPSRHIDHYDHYVALYNPVSPSTVGFAGPRDSSCNLYILHTLWLYTSYTTLTYSIIRILLFVKVPLVPNILKLSSRTFTLRLEVPGAYEPHSLKGVI